MRALRTILSSVKSQEDVIARAIQNPKDLGDYRNYRMRTSTGYFTTQIGLQLDRGPFTWDGHEYLKQLYEETHPHIAGRKATQLGLTVLAIMRVIHHSIFMENYAGGLYFFPTDKDVSEFSRARVTPILENPYLKMHVRDTDSIGLKRIGGAMVYFRGMRSRLALKCHDSETEVLTKRGWKRFSDVTKADLMATRSPSGEFMWQYPYEIHCYDYAGKMFYFKATGLDICVTPNHRMLLTDVQDVSREWFELAGYCNGKKTAERANSAFVRASRKWKGELPDFIVKDGNWNFIKIRGNPVNNRWPSGRKNADRYVSLRDWVAFLGLYVAEGSCQGVSTGKRIGGRVSISQVKHSKHFKTIKSLLKRMPFDFVYSGHNFRVGDMALCDKLFKLGNKYTKHLPKWVLNLPPRYLEILWKWAVMGDGHTSKRWNGHTSYATTSKVLAGQLQELLQKCGRSASVLIQTPPKKLSKIRGRGIKSFATLYLVSERKSKQSYVPTPSLIDYDGKVWCASVPNGTLYTRRNGYAVWSGNSVPADEIVFDELDELQDVEGFSAEGARKMALERLSHSPHKLVLEISNPTFPGFGVDIAFQVSDQHYWHFKCKSCGQYSCLDDIMPKELGKDITFLRVVGKSSEPPCHICGYVHSSVQRVCIHCGNALILSEGEWVPKYPDRASTRGYQFSQFLSKYVSAGEILHEYTTTTQPEVFYNTKMGIPFVSSENRITVDEVLALCDPTQPMLHSDSRLCTMGVDVGKKLHVFISTWNSGTTRRPVIFFNEYDDFSVLDDLMEKFNIVTCVIDGQPEQRKAREFQKRHWSKVWLCFFDDHKRGNYAWDMKQHLVSVRRTEAFDASRLLLRGQPPVHDPLYVFPRQEPKMLEVATHISNDAKKKQEDPETGAIWYEYVRLGVNHYDLAMVYDSIAWSEDLKRRKIVAAISSKDSVREVDIVGGLPVDGSILDRFPDPNTLPEPLRSEWYAERSRKWFKDQAGKSMMPVDTPSGIIRLDDITNTKKSHKSIDKETGIIIL